MKKSLTMLSLLLTVAAPALARERVDPTDFTVTATVKEVSSHKETAGVRSNSPQVAFCSDPKTPFEKGFCGASTSYSDVQYVTRYVLVTEIGHKIYELEGPRVELGKYSVRFRKRSQRVEGVEFLSTDKKGRSIAAWYGIVGERSLLGN